MTRPTAAQLAFARSTLPVRRVASSAPAAPGFAALLKSAALKRPTTALPSVPQKTAAPVFHAAMLPATAGGPAPMTRSEMLSTAQQLMNIPYVWGGTNGSGLDCSAFVSKVWGVSRQTTDSLASVSHAISKDELQAGDALNLTTGRDPEADGHVRLFDRWANPEHTRMYVYEETPPRSVHHVIDWDPHYQPMRRNNVIDG
jgi:cell wall-associated NlpC family hydrolase